MATVAISALPSATGIGTTDTFPIVQGGVTRKVAMSAAFAAVPAIGGTTPNSAAFTTIAASSNITQSAGYTYSQVGGSIFSGWYGGLFTITAPNTQSGTVSALYTSANATSGGSTVTALVGIKIDSNAANGATVTTNYGLLISNQAAGSTNYAIKTGTGLVDFGGAVSVTGTVNINGTAASTTAGQIQFGSQTQSTIGANGAASALTANPLGYLIAFLGTTKIVIPYYNG